jgi:hypothetical protein
MNRIVLIVIGLLALPTTTYAYPPGHPCFITTVNKQCVEWENEHPREAAEYRAAHEQAERDLRRFMAWCYESSLFRLLNTDCPIGTYQQRH